MCRFKWSYKSPNIGYNYRYPTYNPTYNLLSLGGGSGGSLGFSRVWGSEKLGFLWGSGMDLMLLQGLPVGPRRPDPRRSNGLARSDSKLRAKFLRDAVSTMPVKG